MDPALKRDLYSVLAGQGLSLKDWFISSARQYISERQQPPLPGLQAFSRQPESMMLAAEESTPYKTGAGTNQ